MLNHYSLCHVSLLCSYTYFIMVFTGHLWDGLNIWGIPKIGLITPNHPKPDYTLKFSIETHGDLGYPYFRKHPFKYV